MIILKTSGLAQGLSIIPRVYASEFTVSIRDDSTNIIKLYDIDNAVTSGNYLNFNLTFLPILVKNHFYDIRIFSDFNFWNTNYQLWENDNGFWNIDRTTDVTLFRDKIFCTDQEIDQMEDEHYELNKGQFTTYDGYDNTYIVI